MAVSKLVYLALTAKALVWLVSLAVITFAFTGTSHSLCLINYRFACPKRIQLSLSRNVLLFPKSLFFGKSHVELLISPSHILQI